MSIDISGLKTEVFTQTILFLTGSKREVNLYLNWRINKIAKLIKIIHIITINTTNSLILGERFLSPELPLGRAVSAVNAGVGVIVFVGVGVETGKIKVISGNGINVVVAVCDGVNVGVGVKVGGWVGPVGEVEADVVIRYATAARTGLAVVMAK